MAEGIEHANSDPFSHLKQKMSGLNLKFKLTTVNETAVIKILRSLKAKRAMEWTESAQKSSNWELKYWQYL